MTERATYALNGAQAADLVGLTYQGLNQLNKSADPPPKGANGFEPRDFGQWLKRRHLRGVGVDQTGTRYDYEQERARLTKAQADRTELEARELMGEMVRVDVISAEWAKMIGAMRQRLLSIPTKAAPRARGAESDIQAAALLESEILDALGELSDDGIDDRTRSRIERRPDSDATAAAPDRKPVGRPRKKAIA